VHLATQLSRSSSREALLADNLRVTTQAVLREAHWEIASNTLGIMLRKWRADNPQKQVARHAAISARFVSQNELGQHYGRLETLTAMGRHFGKPLPYVLGASVVGYVARKFADPALNLRGTFDTALSIARREIKHVRTANSLGNTLMTARMEEGKTIVEMASVSNVDKSALCAMENGKRFPDSLALTRLAESHRRPLSVLTKLLVISHGAHQYGDLNIDLAAIFRGGARILRQEVKRFREPRLFGNFLKAERGEKSLAEMARTIGISEDWLSLLEKEEGYPDRETLVAFARCFHRRIEEVVTRLFTAKILKEYGNLPVDLARVFDQAAESVPEEVTIIEGANPLGDFLKTSRDRSQQSMALLLRTSETRYRNLEKKKEDPTLQDLMFLSAFFKKPLTDLVARFMVGHVTQTYGLLSQTREILQCAADIALHEVFSPPTLGVIGVSELGEPQVLDAHHKSIAQLVGQYAFMPLDLQPMIEIALSHFDSAKVGTGAKHGQAQIEARERLRVANT